MERIKSVHFWSDGFVGAYGTDESGTPHRRLCLTKHGTWDVVEIARRAGDGIRYTEWTIRGKGHQSVVTKHASNRTQFTRWLTKHHDRALQIARQNQN